MRQWPSSPHASLGTCAYAQPAELPLQIDLLQHADWPSVETLALTHTLLVFQLLLVLLECISLSLPTTTGMYLSGPAFLKLVPHAREALLVCNPDTTASLILFHINSFDDNVI